MSFQFREESFLPARRLPLFVLVDPRLPHIAGRLGLGHNDVAGILTRCRAALSHARMRGMPVAFVRGETRGQSGRLWIKQLEPRPREMMFERRAISCYSSRYFPEAAGVTGEVVFAGFFGADGCFPTMADAIAAGHRVILLWDAIQTCPKERRSHLSAMRTVVGGWNIRLLTTSAWRQVPQDNRPAHKRSQRAPRFQRRSS